MTITTAWNNIDVEIVIYAPSRSSGSLIRLIKSLERADYLGSVPNLTIELPLHVEPHLLKFLRDMKWPSRKVTIRRRVQAPRDITPTEASTWTVESFYPKDPSTSHVLILSPQTEVAPSFYHYLKYAILSYKHMSFSEENSKLLGISLELPTSKPTAEDSPFNPPIGPLAEDQVDALPHFLWQAPNSNAALYFGDKWAEFHSFLSAHLAVQETKPEVFPNEKLVSQKYPAFMELLLELALARGYYMIYPSFIAKSTSSLAKAHRDLYQLPEEFLRDASSSKATKEKEPLPPENDDESLNHGYPNTLQPIRKPLSADSTLANFLDGFSIALPQIKSLDLLSFNGETLSKDAYQYSTDEYARQFQTRYGNWYYVSEA